MDVSKRAPAQTSAPQNLVGSLRVASVPPVADPASSTRWLSGVEGVASTSACGALGAAAAAAADREFIAEVRFLMSWSRRPNLSSTPLASSQGACDGVVGGGL